MQTFKSHMRLLSFISFLLRSSCEGSNVNGTEPADWRSKAVSAWTSQDVGQWLASLQLAEHQGSFEENEITGEHLRALTKEDLQELGVSRMGHRMTITKAIQQLGS